MACTATSTPHIQKDVVSSMDMWSGHLYFSKPSKHNVSY